MDCIHCKKVCWCAGPRLEWPWWSSAQQAETLKEKCSWSPVTTVDWAPGLELFLSLTIITIKTQYDQLRTLYIHG